MNEKKGLVTAALVGLAVVVLGLAIALIYRSEQATKQKTEDDAKIVYHSNQWQQASVALDEQKQVNVNLENELTARKTEITNLTETLTQTQTSLTNTQAALTAAQEEIAKRDARIAELETQNQGLEKQAGELTNAINGLSAQIEDTRNKLAAAEGDKAVLEKELKRLMGEKAELERKFNDLTVLRAQVKKLKSELTIAKRMEWFSAGLIGNQQKGAEKLMNNQAAGKQQKHYDLNVEVNSDGSVKVIPPLTNQPPIK